LGFLNAELKRASSNYPALEEICDVEDTLMMARNKYPGQRNSLDALANRFEVSGYDRSFHGALLDANILADVYIHLTGGQSKFEFMSLENNSNLDNQDNKSSLDLKKFPIPKILVSHEDALAHDERIATINSKRIPS